MNLQSDDFALFGLAQRFALDRTTLDARWKDLQRQAHPDKFVSEGAAAQRLAMQWSVRINEAYQRLKDPLKRAAYLCELNATPVNAENNTAMPTAFLMQQMQWRDDLDEAHTADELERLHADVQRASKDVFTQLEHALDVAQAYAAAVGHVRTLMFIQRFETDVENRLDQIGI